MNTACGGVIRESPCNACCRCIKRQQAVGELTQQALKPCAQSRRAVDATGTAQLANALFDFNDDDAWEKQCSGLVNSTKPLLESVGKVLLATGRKR